MMEPFDHRTLVLYQEVRRFRRRETYRKYREKPESKARKIEWQQEYRQRPETREREQAYLPRKRFLAKVRDIARAERTSPRAVLLRLGVE